MKNLKIRIVTLLLCTFILSSCGITIDYLGDTLPATNSVDVFYDAKDVKKTYKVIGHLSVPTGIDENQAKSKIIEKSKAVGADGIIIHSRDYTGGKDSEPLYKADAIKYSE